MVTVWPAKAERSASNWRALSLLSVGLKTKYGRVLKLKLSFVSLRGR